MIVPIRVPSIGQIEICNYFLNLEPFNCVMVNRIASVKKQYLKLFNKGATVRLKIISKYLYTDNTYLIHIDEEDLT